MYIQNILLTHIFFGVTATPYDAYRYARGEAIKHPLGFDMKLKEPLDFYAVTDHGFYMGMIENYADTYIRNVQTRLD